MSTHSGHKEHGEQRCQKHPGRAHIANKSALLRFVLVLAACTSWAAAGARAEPAPTHSACTAIPPGSETPPVMACETESLYTFDVLGTTAQYEKESYRDGIRNLIRNWLRGEGLDDADWQGAHIDFFLAVPEAAPAGTRARAHVVLSEGRSFVVFLPWQMEDWTLEKVQVGVLDGTPYPESFGYAPHALLVKARPGVGFSALLSSLARHGVHELEGIGGPWYRGQTSAFQEKSTLARIMRDEQARRHVAAVELSALFEWIAHRSHIFSFSWTP